MKIVRKVGAFIMREGDPAPRPLLLFAHEDMPDVALQIPGGGIDAEEAIEAALRREVFEEAGLARLRLVRALGVSEVPSVVRDEVLQRHCFLLEAPAETPDSWIHDVTGAGEDHALRFRYEWRLMDPNFALTGDLGYFLTPEHLPELFEDSRSV